MDQADLPPDAIATIGACLAAEGVDGGYLAFVARHLDLPDAGWRWCCGSACDPCVERLARVVDRARRALCMPPPPLTPPGPGA